MPTAWSTTPDFSLAASSMFDIIATAVAEFFLASSPESRRGRMIVWLLMLLVVAIGIGALVLALTD